MPRAKGAGQRELTAIEIKQAGQLAGVGCSMDQIAAILDISPKTFDRILQRDASVRDAILKGRESAAGKVMGTAYNMAVSGKHPVMTIFWLKTRQRWKEAKDDESEKTDLTFNLNYKK